MELTDELREFADGCGSIARQKLLSIADDIDKEGEKQYVDALLNDGIPVTSDEMAEHGWVRLPIDADGVPIRIGDRVSEPEYQPNGGVVVGIKLYRGWDHWLVNCGAWVDPRKCRHVQPDSWERIIEDAIRGDGGSYGCLEERFKATVPDLVARCKALAEVGE